MKFAPDHRPIPRAIRRDGVKLMTWDSGAGSPTLLCIHGNSCDHTFFKPQVQAWSSAHRMVAVDLRGHGKSDAPRGSYAFSVFVDDCLKVMDALDTGPVVLVGHSMGGGIAAALAADHPDRVAGVVFLDSTLLPNPKALQSNLPAMIEQLKGYNYLEGFRGFFESLFPPTADQHLKEAVWNRMRATPQHVMLALLDDLLGYEGAPLDAVDCPILYIAGGRWRTNPAKLCAAAPHARVEQIPESGHFLTLEAPERVSELVLEFAASLSSRK